MKKGKVLILLTALLAAVAPAQVPAPPAEPPEAEAEEPAHRSVETLMRVESFSLPVTEGRTALRKYPRQDDLYAWLDAELTKEKPAVRLERLSMVKTRRGNQSFLQESDELPYPTEFNPGSIPQNVSMGSDVSAAPPGKGPNPPPPQPPPSGPRMVFSPWPHTPCIPSGFTFRNTGWNLETEVAQGVPELADVKLSAAFIHFNGVSPSTPAGDEDQPLFDTGRFNTQLLARPGRHVFAGTMSPSVHTGTPRENTVNRMWLVFVTVTGTEMLELPDAEEEEEEEATIREAMLRYELISLPATAARGAINKSTDEPALYGWLESELTKKGSDVILERGHLLRVRSGVKGKLEAISQYPYAMEVEPPVIPQNFSMETTGYQSGGPGRVFPPWPYTPSTPAAFTYRNVGFSTEVLAKLTGDGSRWDVQLSAENVRLAGEMPQGLLGEITQPVFETSKVTCQVQAPAGRPVLVSTLSPPLGTGTPGANQEDRVWLLFITATPAE